MVGVMDISAHRISVLLAVHRAGGVVAAADLLHLSPSAISQQIRLLEKEAGVRVLDRTPAGAVLTDSGRVLVQANVSFSIIGSTSSTIKTSSKSFKNSLTNLSGNG